MAKIKKLKTKEVAKKVKELNIFKETREREGFHFPKLFKTTSDNVEILETDIKNFLVKLEQTDNMVVVSEYGKYTTGTMQHLKNEEKAYNFLHSLNKKQLKHMDSVVGKANYLVQVKEQLKNSAINPEVLVKIDKAINFYNGTVSAFSLFTENINETNARSSEFDRQVENLGINNPDRELVRAFSFIGVEIKFEDGKWVYDAENTARNSRGIKFGNGEYFKLPENSVKVFLQNYLNKPQSERHGIVNPKGLFDLYLETAKDTIASKSLTKEDRLITDKQFEMFREDFATDSSNWLAFKSGAISITEEAAHIALATYHKNQLTSDKFKGFSENKGRIWSDAAWAEIEQNDRIDARAIERIQEQTERQFEQYQGTLDKLEEVKRASDENYNSAIAGLQNELNIATSEEAKEQISRQIEELENRRDAVNLTVDFQVEYIEKAVATDEIDGKPIDLDKVIQDAMAYEVTKDANGIVSVSVNDEKHSIEDVQDIIDNLSSKQIEEVIEEQIEPENITTKDIPTPTPTVNKEDVVPNVIGYLMQYRDKNGQYKYGNALEKAALLDRTTYFFASDAYLGKAYETFKEQNPDKDYTAFVDFLEEEGFFKDNENNENFLFTKETLTATLKDIEIGDSTDFDNIIDENMTLPCLMADAISQAIQNTPGMRERFETVSHAERQTIVNDYVKQIEASTDLSAISDPDQINNAIRRWFPTYEIVSDNAHLKDLADVDVNDGSAMASFKKSLIDHLLDTHKSRHDMNEALKSDKQKIVDTDPKYLTPETEQENEQTNENNQQQEPEQEDEPELEEEQELKPVEEREYDPEKFIKKLKPYNQKAGKKFLENLVKSLDKLIKEAKLEAAAAEANKTEPVMTPINEYTPEQNIVEPPQAVEEVVSEEPVVEEALVTPEVTEPAPEPVEQTFEMVEEEIPAVNLDGTELVNQAIIKMFNEIDPVALGFDEKDANAFALIKDIFLGQDQYKRDRDFSGIMPLQVQSCDPSKAYSCKNTPEYVQALIFNALTNSEKLGNSILHKPTLDRVIGGDGKGFNKILKVVEIMKSASPEVFKSLQGMTMDNLTPEAMEALQAYVGKENVVGNDVIENDNNSKSSQNDYNVEIVDDFKYTLLRDIVKSMTADKAKFNDINPEVINSINETFKLMADDKGVTLTSLEAGSNPIRLQEFFRDAFEGNASLEQKIDNIDTSNPEIANMMEGLRVARKYLNQDFILNAKMTIGNSPSVLDDLRILQQTPHKSEVEGRQDIESKVMYGYGFDLLRDMVSRDGSAYYTSFDELYNQVVGHMQSVQASEITTVNKNKMNENAVSTFTEAEIREDLHWHIVHKSLIDTFEQIGVVSADNPQVQDYLRDVNQIMSDFASGNCQKSVRQRADGMGASSLVVPCGDGKNSFNCNTITGFVQSLLYVSSSGDEKTKFSPEKEAEYREIVDKTMGIPGYYDKIRRTVKAFSGCSLPLLTAKDSDNSEMAFSSAITTQAVEIIKADLVGSEKPLNEVINENNDVLQIITDMSMTINTTALTDTILSNIQHELNVEKFSNMSPEELRGFVAVNLDMNRTSNGGIVKGTMEAVGGQNLQDAVYAAIEQYSRLPHAFDGKLIFNGIELDVTTADPEQIINSYKEKDRELKKNREEKTFSDKQSAELGSEGVTKEEKESAEINIEDITPKKSYDTPNVEAPINNGPELSDLSEELNVSEPEKQLGENIQSKNDDMVDLSDNERTGTNEKSSNIFEYILNSEKGETIKTAIALQRITIMKQQTDATKLREYESKLQEAYNNNNVEAFINSQGKSIFTELYPNSKEIIEYVTNPDAQKEILNRTWNSACKDMGTLLQQLQHNDGIEIAFDSQNWFEYVEQYQIGNILQNIKQANGKYIGLDAHPLSSTTKALEQYQQWIQVKIESNERSKNNEGMGGM